MAKHVVTITGGNGGYTLLRGLALYDVDITGVISAFDSGGSTGALRTEFGGIAWGDLRRGLIALSPGQEPYTTVQYLAGHRFDNKSSLAGHNLGNLLLLGLAQKEKSQEKGLRRAEQLFGLPAGRRVMPPSFDDCQIIAELENGELVRGEANIDVPKHDASLRIRRAYLEPEAKPYHTAIEKISVADLIVVGPGDMYTSVVPNLLVEGIPEAIVDSGAPIVYVCNTMTKRGETQHMNGPGFVREISRYLKHTPTYTILNTNTARGETEDSHLEFVNIDEASIKSTGTKVILADVIDQKHSDRHDSQKLAKTIMSLL